MPDDTDLTPQEHSGETAESSPPEPEAPQRDDSAAETPADPSKDALISLALTELQQRRDALQQDIDSLNQRKLQLALCGKSNGCSIGPSSNPPDDG